MEISVKIVTVNTKKDTMSKQQQRNFARETKSYL